VFTRGVLYNTGQNPMPPYDLFGNILYSNLTSNANSQLDINEYKYLYASERSIYPANLINI